MPRTTNVVTVEVFRGKSGQFYWRAKAGNREIVAQSEAYTRSLDALRAARETFPGFTPKEVPPDAG